VRPRKVVALARERNIDLVVVGPEAPLVAGVADACRAAGIAVFGPNAPRRRMLEGSRASPRTCAGGTASRPRAYVRVSGHRGALAALDDFGLPVVIKADGLAAGKGVTVAATRAEAEAAIARRRRPLVIEEFLEGEEASLFALVDGETPCRSPRRRTTSASARATPARTPAAWAPIPPRRC
jgi:phosphoribosylamine--glycine ligase